MIVECPYCKATVHSKLIGQHVAFDPDEDPAPWRTSLVECPSCKNTLVAGQYKNPDGDGWEPATRVWPSPKRFLSWQIPEIARTSLEEAERCLRAGAPLACAVMCGRALEGICRHFKTSSPYLGGGLKELLEKEIIDKRLFQWSQELQRHRNFAAHATDAKISREDAESLLEFVVAICDYIFVLSAKFDEFMRRKAKEAKESKK